MKKKKKKKMKQQKKSKILKQLFLLNKTKNPHNLKCKLKYFNLHSNEQAHKLFLNRHLWHYPID